MSSARDEVLARVTRALADRPAAPVVPHDYRRERGPGEVELFAERVRDYRAEVHAVPAADVPAAVAEALRARGASAVVTPPGVPDEWVPAQVRTSSAEAADAVVTGCHVAVAATGTIVLDHDAPDQGVRALTLLPDYHLVVVPRDRIVADVPDAVTALAGVRTQTWISGPSATSDIELERVEGVHGPRTLVVVVAL
ncbi:LUD domain-containing protein [Actinosynnema sp. NPDC047251]|uniref:LUD domain-containing protein n=1 Tax=Saccharothrix espanaensis (strain ATCC 51144 / DSM 44229 / JCM 9112 / NBRC 15066 / NRRL 15764) TaxID=1179773 RepID=K0K320_SACES|nr:LUD domain-containing protein [Saccharothrix espanaensis]CCH31279.1 hypothetical protein BN6_39920 [Saccharothrix espanaensis DSM 44229]